MPDVDIIELTIPGRLHFRDMALRVIMESCRLVGRLDGDPRSPPPDLPDFAFADRFTMEMTSAFSEIYNNIVIHAYGAGSAGGTIVLQIHIGGDHLVVEITDMGESFVIDEVPAPGDLPTGGMGIYIARAMLDHLQYESGPPNRWRMIKYCDKQDASATPR